MSAGGNSNQANNRRICLLFASRPTQAVKRNAVVLSPLTTFLMLAIVHLFPMYSGFAAIRKGSCAFFCAFFLFLLLFHADKTKGEKA